MPELELVLHAGGGSFKSQLKKADKSGARLAIILGENEVAQDIINIKFLREEREQLTFPQLDLVKQIEQLINEQS